jgi:integrase/recombinase XerD
VAPRRLPRLIQGDEPERLLRAADNERDRLIGLTLLGAGLRVSELTKLEVPDLDFRRRTLFVKESKGRVDRLLPLPKFLAGPLRGWIGARKTGPVFPSPRGGHLTPRAVQKLIKRLAKKAGLPEWNRSRKYHPHALRHTFATRLLRAGADIMEIKDLMGHQSLASSVVYLSVDEDRLREAIDRPYN